MKHVEKYLKKRGLVKQRAQRDQEKELVPQVLKEL